MYINVLNVEFFIWFNTSVAELPTQDDTLWTTEQCPNLMNLIRGLNPPKTGFHFALKIEIEKLDNIFSGTKHI